MKKFCLVFAFFFCFCFQATAIEEIDEEETEEESEEQQAENEAKRKKDDKAARIEEARRKMEEQILREEEERVEGEQRAKQEAAARREAELQAQREAAARREAELQAQREAEAARREAERKAEAARWEIERKNMEERKAKTGGSLYWSERSSAMDWYKATNYCRNLREGGYSDWRLPTIDELRTLIKNCPKTVSGGSCRASDKNRCLSVNCMGGRGEYYCEYRKDNLGYYSKLGDSGPLWSVSLRSDDTCCAWQVGFHDADVSGSMKSNNHYVRCVR
jgi:hypothetical protein